MDKNYVFGVISKLHLSLTIIIFVIGLIVFGNEVNTYFEKKSDIDKLKSFYSKIVEESKVHLKSMKKDSSTGKYHPADNYKAYFYFTAETCLKSVLGGKDYDDFKESCQKHGYDTKYETDDKYNEFHKLIKTLNTYSLYSLSYNRVPYLSLVYTFVITLIFYLIKFWFAWLFGTRSSGKGLDLK